MIDFISLSGWSNARTNFRRQLCVAVALHGLVDAGEVDGQGLVHLGVLEISVPLPSSWIGDLGKFGVTAGVRFQDPIFMVNVVKQERFALT